MVKLTWVVGMMAALSSVACAEQQAPCAVYEAGKCIDDVVGPYDAERDEPKYRVVSFAGDDTRDWKEVYAECDLAECEALAAKLNAREEAFSVEQVTP